jgi:hypothetical protein
MLNSQAPLITILGSGVALGVYIPALLVDYQLKKQKINTEFIVLEKYYTTESQEKLSLHKKAYHKSFSIALMAHKMTRDIQYSLEHELIDTLLRSWENENRLNFIIWSGFWIPIIEKYRDRVAPQKLDIDLCRIDADISASFKIYKERNQDDNEIWLWNWEQKKIIYEIPVTNKPPISYSERINRFVIHGGGWGIGTYQSKIIELEERGILLDIVTYDVAQPFCKKEGNRYFMVDPEWLPWKANSNNQYEFPPFGEIKNLTNTDFKNKEEYHELYDVISQSKAIISKPGGGTLIDSLASATPVILLEPYGYAEQRNSDLWEYLGYGISYSKWQEMNYDFQILEVLHQNLLTRASTTINYPQNYAEKIKNRLS